MNDLDNVKFLRKIFRKNPNESIALKILRCRTVHTAFLVLDTIRGIPFHELSYSLYLIANELRMDSFIRMYEAQIEMAAANPERFINDLHKFFLKMKREIEKSPNEFLLFILICTEAQIVLPFNSTQRKVLMAFYDLCQQNTCYLMPNINIQTQYFAGRSNTEKWLFIRDPLPYADVSDYLFIDEHIAPIFPPNIKQEMKTIQKQNHQYTFLNRHLNRNFEMTIMLLAPFIDDRTFKWVSQRPFLDNMMDNFSQETSVSLENVQNRLCKRNKLLPNEGISFVLASQNAFQIEKVSLIESLRNGILYLIFKAESSDKNLESPMGEFCGFYNTKEKITGSLVSIAQTNEETKILGDNIMTIILSLYASYVCRGFQLPPDAFTSSGKPLIYKLQQHSDAIASNATRKIGMKRDENKYAAEIRNVNGYIRKLPAGQTASQTALEFAKQIGLELASNETFVHPHSKTVFVLKKQERDQA